MDWARSSRTTRNQVGFQLVSPYHLKFDERLISQAASWNCHRPSPESPQLSFPGRRYRPILDSLLYLLSPFCQRLILVSSSWTTARRRVTRWTSRKVSMYGCIRSIHIGLMRKSIYEEYIQLLTNTESEPIQVIEAGYQLGLSVNLTLVPSPIRPPRNSLPNHGQREQAIRCLVRRVQRPVLGRQSKEEVGQRTSQTHLGPGAGRRRERK